MTECKSRSIKAAPYLASCNPAVAASEIATGHDGPEYSVTPHIIRVCQTEGEFVYRHTKVSDKQCPDSKERLVIAYTPKFHIQSICIYTT